MLLVAAGSGGGDDHDHCVNNPVRATGFGPQLSHRFPPKDAQLQMVKMERRGEGLECDLRLSVARPAMVWWQVWWQVW